MTMVPVLPCDREAAALLDDSKPGSMAWRMYTQGRCDAQYDVQAFARHRLAALEEAAKVADEHAQSCAMARSNAFAFNDRKAAAIADAERLGAELIATAIRALSNKGGRDEE